ncbi:serine protease inhibitor swm-1-like [Chironomus tepperi]|uniref:serine protease inhibitor swm-1-like n=1 Tax=Chironomus tepperi TaxID=113505 RepID=UPI00391F0A26
MNKIFAILIFVAVAAYADAKKRCYPVTTSAPAPTPAPAPKCGRNEVFEACTTICDDRTCDNRRGKACKDGCEPRCLCKSGYVRDAKNKCIKTQDCPPLKCGVNETYEPCNTFCGEPTCKRRTVHQCGGGPCTPRCNCKDGYVRNDDRKCIKTSECPAPEPRMIID